MLIRKSLCIEASAAALTVTCADKNCQNRIVTVETRTFLLPSGAFCDGSQMAESVSGGLASWLGACKRAVVVLLANTGLSSVRVAGIPALTGRELDVAAREQLRRLYPFGEVFNESTHVFGYSAFQEDGAQTALFFAALPVAVSDGLVALAQALSFNPNQIKRIDVIEHALARYYAGRYPEPLWLCLPQENGLRVLSLQNRLPRAVYFISHDFGYGERELERIWCAQPSSLMPERAFLFRMPRPEAADDYAWLRAFFISRGVVTSDTTAAEEEGVRLAEVIETGAF